MSSTKGASDGGVLVVTAIEPEPAHLLVDMSRYPCHLSCDLGVGRPFSDLGVPPLSGMLVNGYTCRKCVVERGRDRGNLAGGNQSFGVCGNVRVYGDGDASLDGAHT
jgi:hypothetical protein